MEEDSLLKILNEMIACAKKPIQFSEFNKLIACDKDRLLALEKEHEEVGIRPIDYKDADGEWGISVASIIATITDVLIGKRLAFSVDLEKDIIEGFSFFTPPKE